jgi:hypothetical protein
MPIRGPDCLPFDIVQAAVSHQQMSQLLPDDHSRSIATALALGAVSSSYMSVAEGGSLWQRMTSDRGRTAISQHFVMDGAAAGLDIVCGLLIAGALAAWVPHNNTFWQSFFLTGHPVFATLWGPIVGPLVAVISFVCSVGNIPLAAVLSNGGISFGSVIAFIFADLIALPILNIYRKYYGLKMAGLTRQG